MHSVVSKPLSALPMLLYDPDLHRPWEGTVEATDCSELLDFGWADKFAWISSPERVFITITNFLFMRNL